MNPDPTEIIKLLASGASLPAVVLASLPAGTTTAIRRCAVAGTFDERMYELLLRGADGPELHHLLAAGYVERASRWFRVMVGLAGAAWDSWSTEPAARGRLAAELARYFAAADEHLGELRALLLADQDRARRLFTELFEQADARLDTGECRALIDVVSAPEIAPLLEPETARLLADRTLLLRARELWYREFHQTARYFGRPEPEAAFERLLRGKPARVLNLWAAGRTGKTTQLRWFLARRCVPRRIACAGLDFDWIDPIAATRQPSLAFLECMRQLSRQFPGDPFGLLVREHEAALPLLRREPARYEPASVNADQVMRRSLAILNELHSDTPAVLALDHMEEALLSPPAELTPLLATLASALDGSPRLRLVLSGRYDLAERVESFSRWFPRSTSLQLPRFDADQARGYLTAMRGVADTDLVEALVHRGAGLPFTLSLLADLVRAEPAITPADLTAMDGSTVYLVERVINRIDDVRLRLLVRYGVVPRRLSFDFFEHVIAPAGDFPAAAEGQRALWQRLIDYTGAQSWVATGPEPDTVVFHPDVVRPLRQMLSEQPVFRELHRRAIRYYERRAAQEPDRWLGYTKEALYHRFHSQDPMAEEAWWSAITRARAVGGPAMAADLAADLLSPDYASDEFVLSEQVLAEARAQLARG